MLSTKASTQEFLMVSANDSRALFNAKVSIVAISACIVEASRAEIMNIRLNGIRAQRTFPSEARCAGEQPDMCVFQIAKEEARPRTQGRTSVQSHSSETETSLQSREERVARDTASLTSLT